jgi:hypothetical protein
MTGPDPARHRALITILTGTGVVVEVAVAVFTADVIIGVAAGAGLHRGSETDDQAVDPPHWPPVAHR